jgi:hypothetical protein
LNPLAFLLAFKFSKVDAEFNKAELPGDILINGLCISYHAEICKRTGCVRITVICRTFEREETIFKGSTYLIPY